LTMWADVVICDYNYVFDPRVYLKRYFAEKGGDFTFLTDEAHNLVDRSREMFSAELLKKPFLKLRKDLKELSPKISKTSGRINSFMLEMKKLCGDKNCHISKEQHKDLYYLLQKLVTDCEEYLVKNQKGTQTEELLNLYFDALAFIKISEFYDDRYVTLIENTDDVKIKLFCLDPSYLLGEALKRGKTAVFFSATLTPMNYFREILGGSSEDYTMHLESPFDANNRCLLIADKISTRYKDRERSKSDIADLIKALVSVKKGNYLVFFPSYQYMNMVYVVFTERYSDINTYLQEALMAEHEKENFLSLFKSEPEDTFLAFCVLGGIFSEGIDLKNDRLIGTAVVGVGLPLICTERDVIKDYFQGKNAMGFEYAYMYPGMNKVLQAAGRVIRTEEDRGVILLIDDRFSSIAYKALFPRDWFSCRNVTKGSISEYLAKFWRNK
ncbi:MAG: ATP-dependent DNA helicase, partial [Clostridiaceae bacterium]|nr:ATP-dependent DNA helicase [Clostridiaceae bacterium]